MTKADKTTDQKRLKVLVVQNGSMEPPYSQVTGMKALYELQKELAQQVDLHVVNIITDGYYQELKEWIRQEKEQHGITIRVFSPKRRFGLILGQLYLLYQVCKLLRKERFDIIHEYLSAPILINKGFFYRLFSSRIKTFFSFFVHHQGRLAHPRFGLRGWAADRIIVPTHSLHRSLKKYRYPQKKLEYVPYGVDLKPFQVSFDRAQLRQQYGIKPDEKVVLYIGLLDARKGADVFLRALPAVSEQIPSARFIFVSSPVHKGILYQHDAAKKQYQQWIDAAGDRLTFLEGKQDIAALLELADVFVYPIANMHGILSLPLTLLEAVIAGKALITTKISPMSDLFRHEESALLISPGDSDACADAVVRLLEDSSLQKHLSKEVVALARAFDIHSIRDQVLSQYRSSPSH